MFRGLLYKRQYTRFILYQTMMTNDVYNFVVYTELLWGSKETIRKHKYYITLFLKYMLKIGLSTIEEIQLKDIKSFRDHLLKYKNEPTVYKAICTIRSYMRYRYKMSQKYIEPVRIENIENPYPPRWYSQVSYI